MTKDNSNNPYEQGPIYIQQVKSQTNALGLAGFILSILSLFTGWIPVLGWGVWFLGALFSVIGVFKKPRGFAIAGIIISFIGILFLLIFFTALLAL
ncbi:hypothetical protein [Myroides sp. LJL119]